MNVSVVLYTLSMIKPTNASYIIPRFINNILLGCTASKLDGQPWRALLFLVHIFVSRDVYLFLCLQTSAASNPLSELNERTVEQKTATTTIMMRCWKNDALLMELVTTRPKKMTEKKGLGGKKERVAGKDDGTKEAGGIKEAEPLTEYALSLDLSGPLLQSLVGPPGPSRTANQSQATGRQLLSYYRLRPAPCSLVYTWAQ